MQDAPEEKQGAQGMDEPDRRGQCAEAQQADSGFAAANEALAKARENRAGLAERAENQDGRRIEMARIAGERFQCPPPLLPQRFEFEEDAIRSAEAESDEMDRLTASRERIGPVNLVAADELARIEVASERLPDLLVPATTVKIAGRFRELGFQFITVDLEGFRSGSLNSVVPLEDLQVLGD